MFLLDKFRKTKKAKTTSIQKKTVLVANEEKKALKKELSKPTEKTRESKQLKVSKKQTHRIYNIIKEPHIAEKASYLAEQNKYIFKVEPKANKIEIKKAIEALYGTQVKKVNIEHMPPKKRRIGQTEGWRGGLKKGFKKAIVTLKEGEKIEIISG